MLVFVEGKIEVSVIIEVIVEVRFVCGMVFYLLLEFFGEVLIVENFIDLVVSNDIFLLKNIRVSVFEFVWCDLIFVVENLFVFSELGWVIEWFVKGLLVKLYLIMV